MTGVHRRAALLVASLATAAVVLAPGVALASCIEPPPLPEAIAQTETVFVGSVIELEFEGRLATFHVIEVWKGDIGPEVLVNGGPGIREMSAARAQGHSLATSVDRSYVLKETYIVFPHGAAGEILFDNACSNTQILTPEVEALRPANAYTPVATLESHATPDTDGSLGWVAPTLIGAAVIAAAGAAIYLRRRPNPDIW